MSLDKAWSPTRASDGPFWFGPYKFHRAVLVVLDFLESFLPCFCMFVYYLIFPLLATFLWLFHIPQTSVPLIMGSSVLFCWSTCLLNFSRVWYFEHSCVIASKYVIMCTHVYLLSGPWSLRGRDHIYFPVVMEHNWSINVMFYDMKYVINIENMSLLLFPGRMKVVGLSTK